MLERMTLLIASSLISSTALADHQLLHARPQGPAKVLFADDVPEMLDSEWGFRIGGFGGITAHAPRKHVPVIFVHGNTTDHTTWYPAIDQFKAAGWTDQELWGLSYNGLSGNGAAAYFTPNPRQQEEHAEMGQQGSTPNTSNEVNVADLYQFITTVRDYTGSEEFSIVAHSLGVTLARRTLQLHPQLKDDLVAFVGIAGANHGTSLCPPGSEGVVNSCDEIAADTAWLAELNGPDGSEETYPPAQWMTIYDGTGTMDVAFAGSYSCSPELKGALNQQYPFTSHNDLRLDPKIVDDYREFLTAAEQSRTGLAPTPGTATGLGSLRRDLQTPRLP